MLNLKSAINIIFNKMGPSDSKTKKSKKGNIEQTNQYNNYMYNSQNPQETYPPSPEKSNPNYLNRMDNNYYNLYSTENSNMQYRQLIYSPRPQLPTNKPSPDRNIPEMSANIQSKRRLFTPKNYMTFQNQNQDDLFNMRQTQPYVLDPSQQVANYQNQGLPQHIIYLPPMEGNIQQNSQIKTDMVQPSLAPSNSVSMNYSARNTMGIMNMPQSIIQTQNNPQFNTKVIQQGQPSNFVNAQFQSQDSVINVNNTYPIHQINQVYSTNSLPIQESSGKMLPIQSMIYSQKENAIQGNINSNIYSNNDRLININPMYTTEIAPPMIYVDNNSSQINVNQNLSVLQSAKMGNIVNTQYKQVVNSNDSKQIPIHNVQNKSVLPNENIHNLNSVAILNNNQLVNQSLNQRSMQNNSDKIIENIVGNSQIPKNKKKIKEINLITSLDPVNINQKSEDDYISDIPKNKEEGKSNSYEENKIISNFVADREITTPYFANDPLSNAQQKEEKQIKIEQSPKGEEVLPVFGKKMKKDENILNIQENSVRLSYNFEKVTESNKDNLSVNKSSDFGQKDEKPISNLKKIFDQHKEVTYKNVNSENEENKKAFEKNLKLFELRNQKHGIQSKPQSIPEYGSSKDNQTNIQTNQVNLQGQYQFQIPQNMNVHNSQQNLGKQNLNVNNPLMAPNNPYINRNIAGIQNSNALPFQNNYYVNLGGNVPNMQQVNWVQNQNIGVSYSNEIGDKNYMFKRMATAGQMQPYPPNPQNNLTQNTIQIPNAQIKRDLQNSNASQMHNQGRYPGNKESENYLFQNHNI